MRAAWIFRCQNRQMTQDLAQAIKKVVPARREDFQVAVFCKREKLKGLETYLALNDFVEKRAIDQLYRELSND